MSRPKPHMNARPLVRRADEASRKVRAAGRWFAGYLMLLGVLVVGSILTQEAVFHTRPARGYASLPWGLAFMGLVWWAESHDVHPRGKRRWLLVAAGLYFASYAVLLGPLVRWQAGTSPGWWPLASGLFASPFFVAGLLYRRRS